MIAPQLDLHDTLGHFRDEFVITDPDLVYMDGNSLGRLPKATVQRLKAAVENQWGDGLIQCWGEWWYDLPQRLGAKIGQLIGAKPHEVICCDSTSVNFYKAVMSCLANRPAGRFKIITDNLNFPSDLYLLQGCKQHFPEIEIVVLQSEDDVHLWQEQIEAALDETTALLTLSHVAFKSGFQHDLPGVTKLAHAVGVPVLWDLSHSAGAMRIELNRANVDYAVGCTYKYLNGGPGAPAYLYVREDLQEAMRNPITGWFGQDQPFNFDLSYKPAKGMDRMLVGTPPILSMIAVEPGLDLLIQAGMGEVERKSVAMYDFAFSLWENTLSPVGLGMGSPLPEGSHGSHLTLTHEHAYAMDQALIDIHNVVPDFRAPDGIRFGFSPLYTTFGEIERAFIALKSVVESRSFEGFSGPINGVT